MSEYELDQLEYVSGGPCQGCDVCQQTYGVSENDDEQWQEIYGNYVPSFSWYSCDACGSTLGGDRHEAHGRDENGEIVHLDVCVDCYVSIA